jgi:hypothetical protein
LDIDLKECDGVFNVLEEWIHVERLAKLNPVEPMVVGCLGPARNDAGGDRFLCKAQITAELISGRGW